MHARVHTCKREHTSWVCLDTCAHIGSRDCSQSIAHHQCTMRGAELPPFVSCSSVPISSMRIMHRSLTHSRSGSVYLVEKCKLINGCSDMHKNIAGIFPLQLASHIKHSIGSICLQRGLNPVCCVADNGMWSRTLA